MHFHIAEYAYPHYQLRFFILPRTHLCITIPIYSFFVIYNIEYKITQYSIYIHVNCINYFLGYFLIKIQNVPYTPPYIYVCTLISFSRLVEIAIQLSSLFPASTPIYFTPLPFSYTEWRKKNTAHRIFTPRNCTKLCMDRMICSHASHSIRTPFIEITLHSPGICTTHS